MRHQVERVVDSCTGDCHVFSLFSPADCLVYCRRMVPLIAAFVDRRTLSGYRLILQSLFPSGLPLLDVKATARVSELMPPQHCWFPTPFVTQNNNRLIAKFMLWFYFWLPSPAPVARVLQNEHMPHHSTINWQIIADSLNRLFICKRLAQFGCNTFALCT